MNMSGNLTSAAGQSYIYNTRNELSQTGVPGQLFYHNTVGLLGKIDPGNGAFTDLDYVGANLATEVGGSQYSVLRRYVYGPGTDEPLVWYEGPSGADRRYLHADERGSIIAVSNDAGAVTTINTYDEYGIPGSGNVGRFQYTGQKWIAELGMYDYKARMYSPTLGRFLQTDPIGYGDGMNWYNYAGGDPVNGTDPSGTLALLDSRAGFIDNADEWADQKGISLIAGGHSYDNLGASLAGITFSVGGRLDAANLTKAINLSGLGSAGYLASLSTTQQNSHPFSVPITGSSDEIVLTAPKMIPDDQKYALIGGRYYLNPHYVDPAPWLNLKNVAVALPLIGATAAIAPLIPGVLGPAGPLFGDTAFGAVRQGSLNSGYLRAGFGRGLGRANFRVGIGSAKRDIFSLKIPK